MLFRQRTLVLFIALLFAGGGAIACGGTDDPTTNQTPGDADADGDADPDGDSEPDPDGDSEPDPDGDSEPDPDGDSEPDPDGDSEPDPDGDSEPDFDFADAPDAAGAVLITEFMKDPTVTLPEDGQWVEFYNTTDGELNLEQCEISSSVRTVTIDGELRVGAGELVTVANGDDPGFDADYYSTDLRFSTTADTLALNCDELAIDSVEYDDGERFPSTEGVSVARDSENLTGDSNTGWFWCEGTGEYDGDNVGSPGVMNDPCPWLDEDSSQVIADLKAAVAAEETIDPTALENVLVTYVKPEVGNDEGGFFLQADAAGPAIFVPVDGASPVTAGQLISLEVLDADGGDGFPFYDATFITDYQDLEVLRVYLPPSLVTTDASDADDLIDELDSYEHRLVSAELTVQWFNSNSGTGHSKFVVSTDGMGSDYVELRFPDELVDDLVDDQGIAQSCVVSIADTPMWRIGQMPQFSIWDAAELEVVSCQAILLSATSDAEDRVDLVFSRDLEEGDEDDFSIDGLDIIAAIFVGNEVVLETSTQTPGQTYTVEVHDTLVDAWGEAVTGTAEFTGYIPRPAATRDVVITEFMAQFQGGGGDPGEYIELHNLGTEAFGLGGCILNDGTASNALTISNDVVIEPGGYALFTSSPGGAAELEEDGVFSFALNNGGEEISLTCQGTVIDELIYSGSMVELGISYQKDVNSLGDPNDSGNMEMVWCLTPEEPAFNYWTGDAQEDDREKYGTPGEDNVACE